MVIVGSRSTPEGRTAPDLVVPIVDTVEEAEAFLESWRDSWLPIKRMGYQGLCKLITICWYSQPENYALSGYPGPPVKVPYPYPATGE